MLGWYVRTLPMVGIDTIVHIGRGRGTSRIFYTPTIIENSDRYNIINLTILSLYLQLYIN